MGEGKQHLAQLTDCLRVLLPRLPAMMDRTLKLCEKRSLPASRCLCWVFSPSSTQTNKYSSKAAKILMHAHCLRLSVNLICWMTQFLDADFCRVKTVCLCCIDIPWPLVLSIPHIKESILNYHTEFEYQTYHNGPLWVSNKIPLRN